MGKSHLQRKKRIPTASSGATENKTIGTFFDPPPLQFESKNGIHDGLINGFAKTTGHDLSDVNIETNSPEPAKVGAHAFAQGNNIKVAPRQEKHIPHEMGHVVQQREGRVKANTQVNGMPVNDDKGLEKQFSPAQLQVIQLKSVTTDFGEFRTDKLEPLDSGGVNCILKFKPDPDKIDAKKIGLLQSVKITNGDGSHTGIDPTKEGRRVKDGKGKDYVYDRISSKNNPVYGAKDLAKGDGLDKTDPDNRWKGEVTKLGENATYELGHAYKEKNKQLTKEAGLSDKPSGSKKDGEGNIFETTALGLEGKDKDKYFGSVKWGYTIKSGKAIPQDITIASKGDPTANFLKSAELWNKTNTRGTIEITADPASVYDSKTFKTVTLPKETRLIQKGEYGIDGINVIKGETLGKDDKGTGKEYYVYVKDLKDTGDGGSYCQYSYPKVQGRRA